MAWNPVKQSNYGFRFPNSKLIRDYYEEASVRFGYVERTNALFPTTTVELQTESSNLTGSGENNSTMPVNSSWFGPEKKGAKKMNWVTPVARPKEQTASTYGPTKDASEGADIITSSIEEIHGEFASLSSKSKKSNSNRRSFSSYVPVYPSSSRSIGPAFSSCKYSQPRPDNGGFKASQPHHDYGFKEVSKSIDRHKRGKQQFFIPPIISDDSENEFAVNSESPPRTTYQLYKLDVDGPSMLLPTPSTEHNNTTPSNHRKSAPDNFQFGKGKKTESDAFKNKRPLDFINASEYHTLSTKKWKFNKLMDKTLIGSKVDNEIIQSPATEDGDIQIIEDETPCFVITLGDSSQEEEVSKITDAQTSETSKLGNSSLCNVGLDIGTKVSTHSVELGFPKKDSGSCSPDVGPKVIYHSRKAEEPEVSHSSKCGLEILSHVGEERASNSLNFKFRSVSPSVEVGLERVPHSLEDTKNKSPPPVRKVSENLKEQFINKNKNLFSSQKEEENSNVEKSLTSQKSQAITSDEEKSIMASGASIINKELPIFSRNEETIKNELHLSNLIPDQFVNETKELKKKVVSISVMHVNRVADYSSTEVDSSIAIQPEIIIKKIVGLHPNVVTANNKVEQPHLVDTMMNEAAAPCDESEAANKVDNHSEDMVISVPETKTSEPCAKAAISEFQNDYIETEFLMEETDTGNTQVEASPNSTASTVVFEPPLFPQNCESIKEFNDLGLLDIEHYDNSSCVKDEIPDNGTSDSTGRIENKVIALVSLDPKNINEVDIRNENNFKKMNSTHTYGDDEATIELADNISNNPDVKETYFPKEVKITTNNYFGLGCSQASIISKNMSETENNFDSIPSSCPVMSKCASPVSKFNNLRSLYINNILRKHNLLNMDSVYQDRPSSQKVIVNPEINLQVTKDFSKKFSETNLCFDKNKSEIMNTSRMSLNLFKNSTENWNFSPLSTKPSEEDICQQESLIENSADITFPKDNSAEIIVKSNSASINQNGNFAKTLPNDSFQVLSVDNSADVFPVNNSAEIFQPNNAAETFQPDPEKCIPSNSSPIFPVDNSAETFPQSQQVKCNYSDNSSSYPVDSSVEPYHPDNSIKGIQTINNYSILTVNYLAETFQPCNPAICNAIVNSSILPVDNSDDTFLLGNPAKCIPTDSSPIFPVDNSAETFQLSQQSKCHLSDNSSNKSAETFQLGNSTKFIATDNSSILPVDNPAEIFQPSNSNKIVATDNASILPVDNPAETFQLSNSTKFIATDNSSILPVDNPAEIFQPSNSNKIVATDNASILPVDNPAETFQLSNSTKFSATDNLSILPVDNPAEIFQTSNSNKFVATDNSLILPVDNPAETFQLGNSTKFSATDNSSILPVDNPAETFQPCNRTGDSSIFPINNLIKCNCNPNNSSSVFAVDNSDDTSPLDKPVKCIPMDKSSMFPVDSLANTLQPSNSTKLIATDNSSILPVDNSAEIFQPCNPAKCNKSGDSSIFPLDNLMKCNSISNPSIFQVDNSADTSLLDKPAKCIPTDNSSMFPVDNSAETFQKGNSNKCQQTYNCSTIFPTDNATNSISKENSAASFPKYNSATKFTLEGSIVSFPIENLTASYPVENTRSTFSTEPSNIPFPMENLTSNFLNSTALPTKNLTIALIKKSTAENLEVTTCSIENTISSKDTFAKRFSIENSTISNMLHEVKKENSIAMVKKNNICQLKFSDLLHLFPPSISDGIQNISEGVSGLMITKSKDTNLLAVTDLPLDAIDKNNNEESYLNMKAYGACQAKDLISGIVHSALDICRKGINDELQNVEENDNINQDNEELFLVNANKDKLCYNVFATSFNSKNDMKTDLKTHPSEQNIGSLFTRKSGLTNEWQLERIRSDNCRHLALSEEGKETSESCLENLYNDKILKENNHATQSKYFKNNEVDDEKTEQFSEDNAIIKNGVNIKHNKVYNADLSVDSDCFIIEEGEFSAKENSADVQKSDKPFESKFQIESKLCPNKKVVYCPFNYKILEKKYNKNVYYYKSYNSINLNEILEHKNKNSPDELPAWVSRYLAIPNEIIEESKAMTNRRLAHLKEEKHARRQQHSNYDQKRFHEPDRKLLSPRVQGNSLYEANCRFHDDEKSKFGTSESHDIRHNSLKNGSDYDSNLKNDPRDCFKDNSLSMKSKSGNSSFHHQVIENTDSQVFKPNYNTSLNLSQLINNTQMNPGNRQSSVEDGNSTRGTFTAYSPKNGQNNLKNTEIESKKKEFSLDDFMNKIAEKISILDHKQKTPSVQQGTEKRPKAYEDLLNDYRYALGVTRSDQLVDAERDRGRMDENEKQREEKKVGICSTVVSDASPKEILGNKVDRNVGAMNSVSPKRRKLDNYPKAIHVSLEGYVLKAYSYFEAAAKPLLESLQRGTGDEQVNLRLNNNQTFSTLCPEVTRFFLIQLVNLRRTNEQNYAGQESEHRYKSALLLHGLIKAAELLILYSIPSASNSLEEFMTEHQTLIKGGYRNIIQQISSLQLNEDVTHPKTLAFKEHYLTLQQQLKDQEIKVLVLVQREAIAVVTELQRCLGREKVSLMPSKVVYDYHQVLKMLENASILVWTVISSHGNVLEVQNGLPWVQFTLVVEWDGKPGGQSLWIDHCCRQNIQTLSLFSNFIPDTKRDDCNKESSIPETSIINSESRSESTSKVPDENRNNPDTFIFVASENVVCNTELHYVLTSLCNIELIERRLRDLSLPSSGLSRGWADIIVDERTGVLLQPLHALRQDDVVNRLIQHLVILSLQFLTVYVVLYVKPQATDGYVYRGNIVRAIVRLVAMCAQFKNEDFSVFPIYAHNYQHIGAAVRSIGEACRTATQVWSKQEWVERTWLTPSMSSHERFLLQFPCINSIAAQIMLTALPLSKLLSLPLESLQASLPWIPEGVLMMLHKLIHTSVKVPVKPELEEYINDDTLQSVNNSQLYDGEVSQLGTYNQEPTQQLLSAHQLNFDRFLPQFENNVPVNETDNHAVNRSNIAMGYSLKENDPYFDTMSNVTLDPNKYLRMVSLANSQNSNVAPSQVPLSSNVPQFGGGDFSMHLEADMKPEINNQFNYYDQNINNYQPCFNYQNFQNQRTPLNSSYDTVQCNPNSPARNPSQSFINNFKQDSGLKRLRQQDLHSFFPPSKKAQFNIPHGVESKIHPFTTSPQTYGYRRPGSNRVCVGVAKPTPRLGPQNAVVQSVPPSPKITFFQKTRYPEAQESLKPPTGPGKLVFQKVRGRGGQTILARSNI